MTQDSGPNGLQVTLLESLPAEGRRSMVRYADELTAAMAEEPGVDLRRWSLPPARFAPVGRWPRANKYVDRFLRYPRLVSAAPGDLYHLSDHDYGEVVRRLPPERVVVTCHDLALSAAAEGRGGWQPSARQVRRFRWSTRFLSRAAHVICVSESTRADVHRYLGVAPERTSVVWNGVSSFFRPVELDREAARARLGVKSQHILLSVSTGGPYKNTAATLGIVHHLRSQGMDVVLLRVGRSLSPPELAEVRRLALEDRIVEAGAIADQELVELYNLADLTLCPSHYEGFGLPALESMACGTPVVHSTCAALVEVVGDCGVSAAAADHAGLGEAAYALLTDPNRREALGRRSRDRASMFSWGRAAEKVAEVYRSVSLEANASVRRGRSRPG